MKSNAATYHVSQRSTSLGLVVLLCLTFAFQTFGSSFHSVDVNADDAQEQLLENQETSAIVTNFNFDFAKSLIIVYELATDNAQVLSLSNQFSSSLLSSLEKILTTTISINAP